MTRLLPPCPSRRRSRRGAWLRQLAWCASLCGAATVSPAEGLRVQGLDPEAAACATTLARLNRGLPAQDPAALLEAATQYESGECVARDLVRAAQYLAAAARAGNLDATRRLARKFGHGEGVQQSYANAGAWLSGNGSSEQPLGRWEYSIGYAYTIATEAIERARVPIEQLMGAPDLSLALDLDSLRPADPALRVVGELSPRADAAVFSFAGALREAAAAAVRALPPADPKLIGSARVTIPLSLRWRNAKTLELKQGEAILR
ncbi:MAG TPA: hypothetical protein VJ743_00715 [Albitalea sp.]|nr:hypothetical protein [Albitalea sp.]